MHAFLDQTVRGRLRLRKGPSVGFADGVGGSISAKPHTG
jgi:hypothetical protein